MIVLHIDMFTSEKYDAKIYRLNDFEKNYDKIPKHCFAYNYM